ncbi:MAG: GDP-mannose 4,6-dehydratase [Candidatus Omnitrophica bacterium]|nr:GDP-mannose 4,6-dehydratase [Candidatus Omnitrophota bacterium]
MKILITGGAGFIGVNLAEFLLGKGEAVIILDNLSRPGSEHNLAWLKKRFSRKFDFIQADIRNFRSVSEAITDISTVYHLAAQVAVTSSVSDPQTDFQINAAGTLNILEAVRKNCPEAVVIFASTNKVYGELTHLAISEKNNRYFIPKLPEGVSEKTNLDFHSPYGCSKGAADQYVRDYSRIYGLKTVIFRQSCIYGPHQFGNEDQGWVAYLTLCALQNKEITIYGDGKQVRDILFVDDLISAFELARDRAGKISGNIYNVGGGKENVLSLLELIAWLEKELKREIKHKFDAWRPGDQRVYVSDIRKAKEGLGWKPSVSKKEGLKKLLFWLRKNL